MTKPALLLDFFRCPQCSWTGPVQGEAEVVCPGCGEAYPVEGGIPVLARNWRELEADIQAARAVNPAWYHEPQPPEEASPWRHHLRRRRRFVQDALRSHLQGRGLDRAPRLLDLGCGDGTNLGWLRAHADRIYGCDYNLTRLVRAGVRVPEAVLFLTDLLDIPVREGFFDVVYFNHVLEHVPDDDAALRAAHRVLKPGGLLVLGTPNEGSWWWSLAYKRDPASLASTDHVHFYTAKTLRPKVLRAGFRITQIKGMGFGPPDWALDMRLRKYKFLDDLFEFAGQLLIPGQCSSLYVLGERMKEHDAALQA